MIMSYYNRQSENHNQSNIKEQASNKNNSFTGCPNHPDKPVTHWIFQSQTNEQICYCEKCSIMLASNGFNVVKLKRAQSVQNRSPLNHSTLKNTRRAEIEDFITEVNFQIQQLNNLGAQTDKNLQISQQHYGRIISEVTSYFQQLKNKLQIQKYLVYNRVLSHRSKSQQQLRVLRQQLVSQIEQLSGITIDIQNNMQAAQSVQQDVYQAIMKNYRNQLSNSYQIQGTEILEPTLPFISFPQTPAEIAMFSDNFQLLYEQINRNRLPSVKCTQRERSAKSGTKSCESSRIKTKLDGLVKSSKMGPTILSIHSSESGEQQVEAYSFDNSAMVKHDSLQMRRALFAESKKPLPHEIMIRESLNLTQIRQNEQFMEFPNRPQFSCLEETIPEEMLTSRQSIAEYLTAEALVYSLRNQADREDTETLLIS